MSKDTQLTNRETKVEIWACSAEQPKLLSAVLSYSAADKGGHFAKDPKENKKAG